MSEPLLDVRGLVAGRAGVPAVRGMDLQVRPGEVVALLGPNGAGKTTTLLTVAGLLDPLAGRVEVLGREVTRGGMLVASRLARRGLALVPDDRSLFTSLTVGENLRVALGRGRGGFGDVLQFFPALAPMLGRKASLLSGGEQQMLAIARALVRRPRLLLIDELSLGLAPIVVDGLMPVLRQVATATGCGVLLVEQHVDLALDVADRACVLSHGEPVLSGDAATLRRDRARLEEAYLGLGAPSSPRPLP